jgi:hypothetical protein
MNHAASHEEMHRSRSLQNGTDENWTPSLDELDAFIALIYARGLSGTKGINVDDL